MNLYQLKADWLGNVRGDCLAGIVAPLALIPESIAFSIIAGVDLKVSLYASFCIAVIIAYTAGREQLGMISAATVLCGIFQILIGPAKLGRLMRFISRAVMTGFANAPAILICMTVYRKHKRPVGHEQANTDPGILPLSCLLVMTTGGDSG